MKRFILLCIIASFFFIFQINVFGSGMLNESTCNYINKFFSGHALVIVKIKDEAKKNFKLYINKLKSLYSYKPPNLLCRNSIMYIILSFVIFKDLGIKIMFT